jgi:hypothetical protein
MTASTPSRIFWGGVPTEPDVRKLLQHYGAPTEGTLIAYDELHAILHLPKGSRFKSVLSAWRKQLMKEFNIDTKAEPGKGILILAPHERVNESSKNLIQAARRVRRGYLRASTVPVARLDATSRMKHDHVLRIGRLMHDAITTQSKALTCELKACDQLPRVPAPR